MTHYSDNPGMVRVDYFKPGGKWAYTHVVDMYNYWDLPSVHDAVRNALRDAGRVTDENYYTIVVLEPFHKHAHPVMIGGRTLNV